MKPSRFFYLAADSVDNAIAMMRKNGEDARYIAGGQSLVPMMNFRVAAPSALIDLNGVAELSKTQDGPNGQLQIGAMTRTRRLETDPGIAKKNPLLSAAAAHIAHFQIRNRGTLGGSIAHADPAAELPGIVLVCEADIHLRGPGGPRIVTAADFFKGVFTTAADNSELIEKICFPHWPPQRRWAFKEISRREGDFALVGIAAWFDINDAGTISGCAIGAIGAGDTPMRLRRAEDILRGSMPSLDLFREAADAVTADIDPLDDIHASGEYRREVAAVLVMRTLTEAWERSP